jgi:hypothetical protein
MATDYAAVPTHAHAHANAHANAHAHANFSSSRPVEGVCRGSISSS